MSWQNNCCCKVASFELIVDDLILTMTDGQVFVVDLTKYLDNTDAQQISIDPDGVTLRLSNGTEADTTVDLTPFISTVTQVVTGQEIATHDDGFGNVVSIQESVTTLADNGDGTFTYTSEDGTQTQIDVTNSSVVNNGDGTWTHDNGDGTQVTIDVCAMIADGGCTDTLVDNGDGTFTHTALDGTAVTISVNNMEVIPIVSGQVIATIDDGNGNLTDIEESVTTLADNGDGTFTYTSEDGTQTQIDVTNSSVVNNGDGTWTHDNGDGTQVTLDVCALIADGGCTDTLVDNGDGSFTHTALDGTAVTIPAGTAQTLSTVEANGETISISISGGNTVAINHPAGSGGTPVCTIVTEITRTRLEVQPDPTVNATTAPKALTNTLSPTLDEISGLTATANSFTLPEGNYEIEYQLNFDSTGPRSNFNTLLRQGGTTIDTSYGSFYARVNQGHTQTGATNMFELQTTGGTFDIATVRESTAAGGVTLDSGYIVIRKYEQKEVCVFSVSVPSPPLSANGTFTFSGQHFDNTTIQQLADGDLTNGDRIHQDAGDYVQVNFASGYDAGTLFNAYWSNEDQTSNALNARLGITVEFSNNGGLTWPESFDSPTETIPTTGNQWFDSTPSFNYNAVRISAIASENTGPDPWLRETRINNIPN